MFQRFSKNYAALSGLDSKEPMVEDSDEEQASHDSLSSDYCYETRSKTRKQVLHFVFLYGVIVVLLSCLVWKDQWMRTHEPSVGLWCK